MLRFFLKKYMKYGELYFLFLELQKQRDCASVLKRIPNTKGRDGVYAIYRDLKTVYCDMTTDGGVGLLVALSYCRHT